MIPCNFPSFSHQKYDGCRICEKDSFSFHGVRFLKRNQECYQHHGIINEAIWMLAYK